MVLGVPIESWFASVRIVSIDHASLYGTGSPARKRGRFRAFRSATWDVQVTGKKSSIFCQIPVRIPGNSLYQEEFRTFFSGTIVLVSHYLARMKKKGTLSREVDPDQAAHAMMALTMGLRMSALFLGRDEGEAKQVWIKSVERILLLNQGGRSD